MKYNFFEIDHDGFDEMILLYSCKLHRINRSDNILW